MILLLYRSKEELEGRRRWALGGTLYEIDEEGVRDWIGTKEEHLLGWGGHWRGVCGPWQQFPRGTRPTVPFGMAMASHRNRTRNFLCGVMGCRQTQRHAAGMPDNYCAHFHLAHATGLLSG